MPAFASAPWGSVVARVVLCAGVGLLAVPVGVVAGAAASLSGSVAVLLGVVVALVAVVALVLAGVHRLTAAAAGPRSGRSGVAGDLGWGAGVAAVSVVVVGGCALAWQLGGHAFGPYPLVWWLLGGLGLALVGAVFTARTTAPAAVVVAAVVVAAVVVAAQRPPDPRVLAQQRLEVEAVQHAGYLALTFTYVTDLAGYDQGAQAQTNTASGLSRRYVPLDEPAAEGPGLDRSVVLTAQEPSPAACGRAEALSFDDLRAPTCQELADGSFYRVAQRYHEVVVARPGVTLSATATQEVPVQVLQRAVDGAHVASRAQIEQWNLGAAWVEGQDGEGDGEGAPAIGTGS